MFELFYYWLKIDASTVFGYNLFTKALTEVFTLRLVVAGRCLTFAGILGLVVLTLFLAGSSGFESTTLYARDSGESFAKFVIQPGQQLRVRLNIKVLKNNNVYLLLEKGEEEIQRFAEDWQKTRNEMTFEEEGEYSLKVVFEDPSADRRLAEVEVYWLIAE